MLKRTCDICGFWTDDVWRYRYWSRVEFHTTGYKPGEQDGEYDICETCFKRYVYPSIKAAIIKESEERRLIHGD